MSSSPTPSSEAIPSSGVIRQAEPWRDRRPRELCVMLHCLGPWIILTWKRAMMPTPRQSAPDLGRLKLMGCYCRNFGFRSWILDEAKSKFLGSGHGNEGTSLINLKRTIMATPLYPLARALKRSARSSQEKLAER